MLVAAQDDPSVSNITRDLLRQAALAAPAGVEQDPSATDGDATRVTGQPKFREGEEVIRQAVLDMGKGVRGESDPTTELQLFGQAMGRITPKIANVVRQAGNEQGAVRYIQRTLNIPLGRAKRVYDEIMATTDALPLVNPLEGGLGAKR